MIRQITIVCVALCLLPAATVAQEAVTAPAPIVFVDIAGPKDARLHAFYADLFDWKVTQQGTFTTTATTPLPGTIREDPAETLVYVGVTDIVATLARVQAHGGAIELPRLVVPGRVIVAIFKDPAGNRVGLVEIQNGKAKIP